MASKSVVIYYEDGVAGRCERSLYPGQRSVVGRGADADMRISDPAASRKHMQVSSDEDGTVTLHDMGSTNGTFLNGARIHGTKLVTEDCVFTIGSTSFTLKYVHKGFMPISLTTWLSEHGKALAMSVLLVAVIGVVFHLFFSGKPGKKITAPDSPSMRIAVENREASPNAHGDLRHLTPEKQDMASDDYQSAMEYYRRGLYFYDTGNLKNSLVEFRKAAKLAPNNNQIVSKLTQTIRELHKLVDELYDIGLTHENYFRFREAELAWTQVVQLSEGIDYKRRDDAIEALNRLALKKNRGLSP